MVRSMQGKHPNYYEALLQLRDVSPEIIEFAENEIDRVKLLVSKQKELKMGMDYYCSDSSLTRALGKRLQDKFGGELKVTATLHTKKDNKELYRTTVLFREAQFKKGDEVKYLGEIYLVRSMDGKIFLQNLNTGKKIHLKYKEMSLIKKVN